MSLLLELLLFPILLDIGKNSCGFLVKNETKFWILVSNSSLMHEIGINKKITFMITLYMM